MVLAIHKSAIWAAAALAASSLSVSASAQSPTGLSSQAPATQGTTDVAKEGFQAVSDRVEESKDSSSLKLTLGGFLSQGNSRALALTTAADYTLRRSASQFTAQAAVNYGRSAPAVGESYETTVNNQQARVRYDYFFSDSIAGFFAVSGRKDRFQGLDLRLNVGPGLAYYFIDEKVQRLWVELGYDFQYDLRNQDYIDDAASADPPVLIADTEKRHNVRGFIGYVNQMSDAVKFSTGLEYLQNVTKAENARINFDAGLAVQLNQDFAVAMTVSLKYDNNPLPGVEKTDLITALNLVYTMD